MSVYYEMYAEIKIKDAWCALGPFVQKQDGSFKFESLYWAQSVFRRIDDELRDHVIAWGLPEDASQELLANFHDQNEDLDWWGKPTTYREYYDNCVYSVDFEKAVASKIIRNRFFKYRGYVFKHTIASFECGEIEDIDYWYTKEEYDALEKDEQREYAYFEWNNADDEYGIYCDIKQKVDHLKEWFINGISYSGDGVTWKDLECTPIRLIVCRS